MKQPTGGARRPQYLAMLLIAVCIFGVWLAVRLLSGPTVPPAGGPAPVTDADIVIPVADVTETVAFYPALIDGVTLEVMAVRAPDGTVRTAFNTCQVCYASGRGYYTQRGTQLVCENCKNRFEIQELEMQRGGCNPIPIPGEDKLENEDAITISHSLLTRAAPLFATRKG